MTNKSNTGIVRNCNPEDAAQVCTIYNEYILRSIITFEEVVVSMDDMRNRIDQITKKYPWIVYESEGEILGYAYAGEWKSRCAYKHSVESTVYLKKGHEGKGIGSSLYDDLLSRLRNKQIHAVIGGIALPNTGSVAFDEKYGFEKVAHFKEVGYKFEQWIDVGYWELIF